MVPIMGLPMSLAENRQKIKGFLASHDRKVEAFLHILIILGVGFGGYVIGLNEGEGNGGNVGISVFSPTSQALPTSEFRALAGAEYSENSEKPTSGSFVASSKGTKYHRIDCSGAKSINEENRVYFATEESARAAGYAPAGNCPGLR
jgi:hypothetical protein